ncbi:MAG: ABC transporter ATP-binding protein [Alphaproteobacteria bacterium]|nr:ABC transporter ATP-binding protein [Alphaproteobacteria bacterium]
MKLLSVRDLVLDIGSTPILGGIDLDVDAGQVLGIVGESGSGKSMTALAIMGLAPTGARLGGKILLKGADLAGHTEAEMCAVRGGEIGMIFQEPMTALNPVMTIGDQVAETVLVHQKRSRAEAREIAGQTLERVELPQSRFPLNRYPHELSGGQRQRVVIAMAIALRPALLIADEPTTALDVTTQAQILDLLARLVDEDGMGMILITHDLAVVAEHADRIAIMRAGEIVERGPATKLLLNLKHPYSKALFEASNHVPARAGPPKNASDEPILVARDVVRDYVVPRTSPFARPGRFRAVNKVSLQLNRGENLGLVGESGCGKSTLARAILALEPLQGGQIFLQDRPVDAPEARRQMQVVFQDPYGSFNPRHTIARSVAEPFHLLGAAAPAGSERADRVALALKEVGLDPKDGQKFIHEFSGGQRQRVAIARALIISPALIILDEAVSALDVSIRAQILDLLAELSDRLHLSYLFISHDLNVVRAVTDRVLIMKSGEIVEEGETAQVFNDPQNAYTRELLASAPSLDEAIARRLKHA